VVTVEYRRLRGNKYEVRVDGKKIAEGRLEEMRKIVREKLSGES